MSKSPENYSEKREDDNLRRMIAMKPKPAFESAECKETEANQESKDTSERDKIGSGGIIVSLDPEPLEVDDLNVGHRVGADYRRLRIDDAQFIVRIHHLSDAGVGFLGRKVGLEVEER